MNPKYFPYCSTLIEEMHSNSEPTLNQIHKEYCYKLIDYIYDDIIPRKRQADDLRQVYVSDSV